MARKEKSKWEFGDFQTPIELAFEATKLLVRRGLSPASVVEPTCGKGAFLIAAINSFPEVQNFVGGDINEEYLQELRASVALFPRLNCEIKSADFFRFDWSSYIRALKSPVLVLGNPPWVTSAELGLLGSSNLPEKSNFQGRRGLDALTGKSNFDISEWMLLEYLAWLTDAGGEIAILCKSSVARKILLHAWKEGLPIELSEMYSIDAKRYFDAAVDACFFRVKVGRMGPKDCVLFDSLDSDAPRAVMGFRDETLLSNVSAYSRWRHLRGDDGAYIWRSGVKHDCSKVMELERLGELYKNGLGEVFALEDDYVYPMLKSSDLATAGDVRYGRKYMLVTQTYVGEDTGVIKSRAQLTWNYLERHKLSLNARGSSIYRNRPSYSVFGVGEYAFAPWKVAISGFYRSLKFRVVQPLSKRVVVLDDTSYFLPCWSWEEVNFVSDILNSVAAQEFLGSIVFWEEKRPITVDLLKKLSLRKLSAELNRSAEYEWFSRRRADRAAEATSGQLSLGISEARGSYAHTAGNI